MKFMTVRRWNTNQLNGDIMDLLNRMLPVVWISVSSAWELYRNISDADIATGAISSCTLTTLRITSDSRTVRTRNAKCVYQSGCTKSVEFLRMFRMYYTSYGTRHAVS